MASVIKNPPLLEDLENYEQWKEDVLMWKEITDLGKSKQALAVHLTLKGQARQVANQVSTDDKKKENGLEILLEKLDESFLKEPERRKFMAYQDFEECTRKEDMSVCDFMREFDTKYFKMKEKGMELPDEVLAFRLVKNCKLTDIQKDQVMASTKPLSFKEVRATLKRMFESSSGLISEENSSVKVKEEPLYVTKVAGKCETTLRKEESIGKEDKAVGSEEVMWATYRSGQGSYDRNWNRRPNRHYGRYTKRNWRQMGYNNGFYEFGSKNHWARNFNQKEIDKKEA